MQFGFRKGRSAVDTIQERIRTVRSNYYSIGRKKCLRCNITGSHSRKIKRMRTVYFRKRAIHIQKGVNKQLSPEVPQGSLLGPTLWGVVCDGVLRMNLPDSIRR